MKYIENTVTNKTLPKNKKGIMNTRSNFINNLILKSHEQIN